MLVYWLHCAGKTRTPQMCNMRGEKSQESSRDAMKNVRAAYRASRLEESGKLARAISERLHGNIDLVE